MRLNYHESKIKRILHLLKAFIDTISYLINAYLPDLIFRDFNINLLSSSNQNFIDFMRNKAYVQLFSQPTHILGSLLDHAYISQSFNAMMCQLQNCALIFQ